MLHYIIAANFVRTLSVLLFSLVTLSFYGCAGSAVHLEIYDSGNNDASKIQRLAIMPMIVIEASKTSVSSTRTDYWLSETRYKQAMSPAEYLPAEKVVIDTISSFNPTIDVIKPDDINKAFKKLRFENYEQAVKEVARRFNVDRVVSMRIRNLNLIGGGAIHGHSGKGNGHVDITIYNADGSITWSISSQVRYQKGSQIFNMIPDPAPSLSDFVGYFMGEIKPKIALQLGQIIQEEIQGIKGAGDK